VATACAFACAAGLAAIAPAAALADDPSAATGAVSSTVTLRKGDRGRAVRRLQRRLDVGADGVFGSRTQRMVKRFQRRQGLVADGIVGTQTRRALGLHRFARESVVRRGRKGRRGTGRRLRRGARLVLERIAECESGGDPTAVSYNRQFRGKYQFLASTWKANGGEGRDPAKASEAEQDRVALELYRAEGTDPWPVCGRSLS